MNDHIPDVTKMIGDTPRTDAVIARDTGDSGLITELASESRQLERELNAANARIKRLEEAGDAVAAIIGPPGSAHWADENQVDAAWNNWDKAKEAKP